jgi:hypothetical protein
MEVISKIAEQYGLFVALVVYVIWDSRQREANYVSIINKLSDKLKIVDFIKSDVEEMKEDIKEYMRG